MPHFSPFELPACLFHKMNTDFKTQTPAAHGFSLSRSRPQKLSSRQRVAQFPLQTIHGMRFVKDFGLVGLLLIGVAAWGKGFGLVSSIHIIGGVIAVGVFLLLIAIVGLIGAIHHHQVMLFFYMVILFIVFLFQFGVSCSCLAMNGGQQEALLNSAWRMLENKTKMDLENQLNCCGLLDVPESRAQFELDVAHCTALCKSESCHTCGDLMLTHATVALKILGGVGLFFSFTEGGIYALLHPVTPSYNLLHPATPYYPLLRPAIPCYTLLFPTTPCYTLLCPTTP
ncbi:hypothetical protein FQN60_002423, partial [Etheostoma spectabile]